MRSNLVFLVVFFLAVLVGASSCSGDVKCINGAVSCGGACLLLNDAKNCGTCGNVCANGTTCACPAGAICSSQQSSQPAKYECGGGVGCPTCGSYDCTGTDGDGNATSVHLDLASAGAAGCADTAKDASLTCDGKVGGQALSGYQGWSQSGSTITMVGSARPLTCTPSSGTSGDPDSGSAPDTYVPDVPNPSTSSDPVIAACAKFYKNLNGGGNCGSCEFNSQTPCNRPGLNTSCSSTSACTTANCTGDQCRCTALAQCMEKAGGTCASALQTYYECSNTRCATPCN